MESKENKVNWRGPSDFDRRGIAARTKYDCKIILSVRPAIYDGCSGVLPRKPCKRRTLVLHDYAVMKKRAKEK